MKQKKTLSRAKQRLLNYLQEAFKSSQSYPTYQQICDDLEIKSRSTIHFHMEDLVKMGYVEKRVDGSIFKVHESLELEEPKALKVKKIPLVGSIAASPPNMAFEVLEEITVPDTFIGSEDQVFALEVRGPSMQEEGICDGDMVFIRRQPTAMDGQIVAVSINGETTLKRMSTKGGELSFVPSNKDMSPIRVSERDEIRILGILEGYYHRYFN